ncbi:MAG: thiamine ABC transporter substrate-binding protein [Deltaproteobacteria bacterium]|nr:thiamine ABC transporter substrate-binding protein [Deltaproteobacteria bacterium]
MRPLHAEAPSELVLYTYDSLLAKGGLGPALFEAFEKKFQCKIKALANGDGGQILTRLKSDLDRKKPTADIVLGIDQNLWPAFKKYAEDFAPQDLKNLHPIVLIESGFVPFDYGVFSFIADTKNLKFVPKNWNDLLNTQLKRKILLEDPRTSTPGLGFILGVQQIVGADKFNDFFKQFSKQWLTLTPSWSQAYGLFLKGEAPLVWSYTTSEAYHQAHGDSKNRYRALEFKDGHPIQIEGAILIKNSKRNETQTKLSKSFLEFLISKEAQALIPEKNWMMPARKNVPLPASFKNIPQPEKLFKSTFSEIEIKNLLKAWELSSQ